MKRTWKYRKGARTALTPTIMNFNAPFIDSLCVSYHATLSNHSFSFSELRQMILGLEFRLMLNGSFKHFKKDDSTMIVYLYSKMIAYLGLSL